MFTWEKLKVYVNPLIKMFLIIIIGHIIAKCIVKILKRALDKTKIEPSLSRFLTKTVNIVFHLLIFMSALSALGVSTSGVLAALSAAAVGVAVALKDSLSNVAGGILLLISPRFFTGDFIEVQGDMGNVVSIDLLHTTIRTIDNKMISIPNGLLLNNHIINYTKEPYRRLDLTIPVSYDADIDRVKSIIKDVVMSNNHTLHEPEEPMVRVMSYGDSSVNIILRAWCKTENYWEFHFDMNEHIRDALRKENMDIPYNQIDVHIKNN